MEKEELWDVLVRFHNDVGMPDVRRALQKSISRRFDRIDAALDALLGKFGVTRRSHRPTLATDPRDADAPQGFV